MKFYRGYDSIVGFDSDTSFIWVSDDKEYAAIYGDSLAEVEIDEKIMNVISYQELEKIADELDYDIIDILYTPCEKTIDKIKSSGYNAFTVEDYDYRCLCLLDKSLIQDLE